MVDAVNNTSSITATGAVPAGSAQSGFGALGQKDFFRLLTAQMQMQDPFSPVDNKEMLAQMAQFSSLAGISDMGSALTSIAEKLDTLIAIQSDVALPAASELPTGQAETPATQS